MDLSPRSNGGEVPAELEPAKPRRVHRAKVKPAEPPALSERALASAWAGLYLVLRFLTWVLAGRDTSPVAGWTGEVWKLDPLTAKEAADDASELAPLLGDLPPRVVRVLSAIGAPVLMAQRVAEKMRHAPRKPPAKPPPTPALAPAPPAVQ